MHLFVSLLCKALFHSLAWYAFLGRRRSVWRMIDSLLLAPLNSSFQGFSSLELFLAWTYYLILTPFSNSFFWWDLPVTHSSFAFCLLSVDLVALLQKPVPHNSQASEVNSFETSQQQGFGQALVFTNSQHNSQMAQGTGSSTAVNPYPPQSLVTHFYFSMGF